MYTGCLAGGRYLIAPFLSDLTVDLLLRSEGTVVSREPRSLFASMATADTIKSNKALTDYLAGLPALRLNRLDTASGSLRMDLAQEQRSFSSQFEAGENSWQLRIELPERIEGGYWRTPGVLQMAFWKGRRASFVVPGPDGSEISAELECLVVSTDGIRLVTAGSTPDILIGYDQCR